MGFFDIFKKKQTKTLNYKSLGDADKKITVNAVPEIMIPTNDKKNILIMDDFDMAGEITQDDINFISRMADSLRGIKDKELEKKYDDIIQKLDNDTLVNLAKINNKDFNIIMATGKLAGFSVINAVDKGLRIDYAVLDIILGGAGIFNGETKIVDGIDVGKYILANNKSAKVLFFSGCSFEKQMSEYKRIMELTEKLEDMVIHKNNDLLYKKKKLINLLGDDGVL